MGASEREAEVSERLADLSDRLADERDDAFPLFTERLSAIEQELETLAGDLRAHTADLAGQSNQEDVGDESANEPADGEDGGESESPPYGSWAD